MGTKTTGSSFEIELREHLGRLISDPSTLHDFKHWFTRALWDAESTAPDDILRLAYRVENLIGILDAGLWSEAEFVDEVSNDFRVWSGEHSRRSERPIRAEVARTGPAKRLAINTYFKLTMVPPWNSPKELALDAVRHPGQ
jgi:hypothetical protein